MANLNLKFTSFFYFAFFLYKKTSFNKIQEIIVDQLDKEEEEVKLETNFREELDADSLDLFQVINDIEDEFDIKIESEEGLNTVGDLVSYVDAELAKQ